MTTHVVVDPVADCNIATGPVVMSVAKQLQLLGAVVAKVMVTVQAPVVPLVKSPATAPVVPMVAEQPDTDAAVPPVIKVRASISLKLVQVADPSWTSSFPAAPLQIPVSPVVALPGSVAEFHETILADPKFNPLTLKVLRTDPFTQAANTLLPCVEAAPRPDQPAELSHRIEFEPSKPTNATWGANGIP